jgi:hypothetical protein
VYVGVDLTADLGEELHHIWKCLLYSFLIMVLYIHFIRALAGRRIICFHNLKKLKLY